MKMQLELLTIEEQALVLRQTHQLHHYWCLGDGGGGGGGGEGGHKALLTDNQWLPPPSHQQRWKSHRQLFRPDWGSSVWRTDG